MSLRRPGRTARYIGGMAVQLASLKITAGLGALLWAGGTGTMLHAWLADSKAPQHIDAALVCGEASPR